MEMLRKFFALQIRRFFKAPNYHRAFGLMDGVRLLFALEKQVTKQSNRTRSYLVPGYNAPIYLRNTDHSIFWQCLVVRQYNLSEIKQNKIFLQNYHDVLARGLSR